MRRRFPKPNERLRAFTRSTAFWSVEMQKRRRDRLSELYSGTFLVTETGETLVTEGGDFLVA